MKDQIRRNTRVWFFEVDRKRTGLVEETRGDLMDIRMDGFGGKVVHTARKKDGKWYAYAYKTNEYDLELFKV